MNRGALYLKAVARHPLRALAALGWLMTGKKIRARNKFGVLLTNVAKHYQVWQLIIEDLSDERKRGDLAWLADHKDVPRIVVLIDATHGSGRGLQRTLKSLDDQWLLPTDVSTDGSLPEEADYYCWIRPGDTLSRAAISSMTLAIIKGNNPDILFSDNDQIGPKSNRLYPHFKPAWNFELLKFCDYIGGLCLVSKELVSKAETVRSKFSWQGRYEMLLQIGRNEKALNVQRVEQVLYHYHVGKAQPGQYLVPDSGALAVQQEFAAPDEGIDRVSTGHFGFIRHQFRRPEKLPLVSIVVCTRDRLDLVRPCIESVLEKTDWASIEIILVDNGSTEPATLKWLDEIHENEKVTVLRDDRPFNYSALNNFGVDAAKGDFICLLNNDTEVISREWLGEMMAYAVRDDIGAVGAQLLYDDKRIQHAGVFTGIGRLAAHGHRFLKLNEPGYFFRAHLPQQVSAVTAACLVVSKAKFTEVGGLNEQDLVVAFNDVDLCLKLDEAGYSNIYTPYARLYHYESKSRGKDIKGEKRARYLREVAWMQNRWKTDKQVDRFYHPGLTIRTEDFAVRITKE